jgi:hypothetical protein
MFVANGFGRGFTVPAENRTKLDEAVAQGWRQSLKTTVEQPLMRGLVTAFPLVRSGLPRSE